MKWYRAERETPYIIHSAASVLSTSVDRSRRATTIAKHSREYSSTTVKIFSVGGRRACGPPRSRTPRRDGATRDDGECRTRQPATTGLVSAVSAAR